MEPVNLLYIVKTFPDKITTLLETTVIPLDTIKSFVRFEQIKSVIRVILLPISLLRDLQFLLLLYVQRIEYVPNW